MPFSQAQANQCEQQLAEAKQKTLVTSEKTLNYDEANWEIFRDRLADGTEGPEMVWIPAGTFRMGDIQGIGYENEHPVHEVSVERFAMSRYEVTFAEYDKFTETTGREKPSDNGWGRDNRPVINVSWHNATAYTQWLSEQTGHQYRLPTEAEWEYAARAGTETARYWGNNPDDACRYANIRDKTLNQDNGWGNIHNCTDHYVYTAPVGSFKPNAFGLFDMLGNVWEWVADPWHSYYENAPSDGSIWEKPGENKRLLRGGSWFSYPFNCRAANRSRITSDFRLNIEGFRVVVVALDFLAL